MILANPGSTLIHGKNRCMSFTDFINITRLYLGLASSCDGVNNSLHFGAARWRRPCSDITFYYINNNILYLI